MAPRKAKNLNFDPEAYEALKTLQAALQREGIRIQARLQDIASALALYTSPQQAAGMLTAFSRRLADQIGSEAEAPRDSSG